MDTVFEVQRNHFKKTYEVAEFRVYDDGRKHRVELVAEYDDFSKACDECEHLNYRVQSVSEQTDGAENRDT